MAVIKSGASSDQLLIDSVSKAARTSTYDSTGRELSLQSKNTYSVTTAFFTPAATATDIFKITGSASKTIRILDLRMGGTATAAATITLLVIKRSSDDTAGTFVAGTSVPHDSNNPAATAVVGHYTVNPTLGGTVGTITVRKVTLPISTTAAGEVNTQLLPDGAQSVLDQPIVLRGTTQVLVINNNGAAIPAGGAGWYITCMWIEE